MPGVTIAPLSCQIRPYEEQVSTNLQAIASYISRRLDEVSTNEDIQTHAAWPRVAAEMLGYDVEAAEFF